MARDDGLTFAELESEDCQKLAQYSWLRLCWESAEHGKMNQSWVENTIRNRRGLSMAMQSVLIEGQALGIQIDAWIDGCNQPVAAQ